MSVPVSWAGRGSAMRITVVPLPVLARLIATSAPAWDDTRDIVFSRVGGQPAGTSSTIPS